MTHPFAAARILILGACGVLGACTATTTADPRGRARDALMRRAVGVLVVEGESPHEEVLAVVTGSDDGFSTTLHRWRESREGGAFEPICRVEPLQGEELAPPVLVEIGGTTRAVALVTAEDDPDERLEEVVVARADDCRELLRELVVLPRADHPLLLPRSARGGVVVDGAAGVVRLVDSPVYLTLDGREGPVTVLGSVVVRTISLAEVPPSTGARVEEVFAPMPIEASWTASGEGTSVAPMLHDGRSETSLALRPGESGTLELGAPAPIAVLEVRHGCLGENLVPLTLSREGAGEAFATGSGPRTGSWVAAAGRSHLAREGGTKELLVVAEPASPLQLHIAAGVSARCLREVRAFTVRDAVP